MNNQNYNQIPISFVAGPVPTANQHADQFTSDFLTYLPENVHVYNAFENEALQIAQRGFKHYSARTIVEVLRHHSALKEAGSGWKLNDWRTPYLARLFALLNPLYGGLFEFRVVKAVNKKMGVA